MIDVVWVWVCVLRPSLFPLFLMAYSSDSSLSPLFSIGATLVELFIETNAVDNTKDAVLLGNLMILENVLEVEERSSNTPKNSNSHHVYTYSGIPNGKRRPRHMQFVHDSGVFYCMQVDHRVANSPVYNHRCCRLILQADRYLHVYASIWQAIFTHMTHTPGAGQERGYH